MGLQLIYGRSGSGKTKYIRDRVIAEAAQHESTNYIIMVPEQFNLQTQTDYVLAHPDQGILNIDILSFKRLAYRIFSEVGFADTQIIDESGKLMVLKKVVSDVNDALTILQRPLKRIDSVAKLKSVLSEFAQYNVKKENFQFLSEDMSQPGFSKKIEDLFTVSDAFYKYISEKYITDEQVMAALADKLGLSEFAAETVFVFDGYTGFTYQQYEVLRKLIKHAKEVIVSVTMDIRLQFETVVPAHALFALSVKTKTDLIQIAAEEKVKIHKPVCLERETKSDSEFDFLEKNLFGYTKDIFEKKTDRIVIMECNDSEEEVLALRSHIAGLIRSAGYTYRDIAVVTGDIERYAQVFEKAMNEAHIPCFVDHSKALLCNAAVEAIRALILISVEDFSYKSVFRYFRSGMSSFTKEETDLLDNYVSAVGMCSFSSWKKEWKYTLKGQDSAELLRINELKDAFLDEISDFIAVFGKNDSNVKEKTFALYELIASMNFEGKLLALARNFEKSGDYVRSVEYAQVYAFIIHLMDELVEILGDERISDDEYLKILDAGLSAGRIGVLPPGEDYVLLGDVKRTRFSRIKVLFLLGANEGIIPDTTVQTGFINESERLYLKDKGINLAPSLHEEYFTQRYYLYRMLNKASERLYISYSLHGDNSEDTSASYIVREIHQLFPECLCIRSESDRIEDIETKADAYDYLLTHQEEDRFSDSLYAYLLNEEEYKHRLALYQMGKLFRYERQTLSDSIAEKLYLGNSGNLNTSVSRLEQYNTCPFAYFLRYGLDLSAQIKPDFAAVDYGIIFHAAMENYVKMIHKIGLDITDISEENQNRLAEECINEAYKSCYRSSNEPSARDRFHIKRMIRIMKRTVWALSRQFERSGFQIRDVEFKFDSLENEYSTISEDGRKLVLSGKIDRIDWYMDDDKEYVRVVDYKTGTSDFSLSRLYNGLQLQLMLYLDTAVKKISEIGGERKVIPAGAFYYNISDPIIEVSKAETKEETEEALLKALDLKGFCNFDTGEKNMRRGGNVTVLNALRRYACKKAGETGRRILSGNITPEPYSVKDSSVLESCAYCDYHDICRFDSELAPEYVRIMDQEDEDIILERIMKSEGADHELDE